MLETTAIIVFFALLITIIVMLTRIGLEDMRREAEAAEAAEARRQRLAEVDAEMCRIIRAYGESRIRTIEAMGEIEINRIRNANK